MNIKAISILGLITICLALNGRVEAQYQAAPMTVSEPVAVQMIQAWARSLARNDVQGLAYYYADPRMVEPWKQRIGAAPVRAANLVAVHSVRPAPGKSWGGVPLSGEVRFTVEFMLQGYDQVVRETRVWGLTNKNGYLQIANEVREQSPEQAAPSTATQSPFPKFGSDPAPAPAQPPAASAPMPYATPEPQSSVAAAPQFTPSLNEGPIEKDKLIQDLWDQLLTRYKKSYEMRSEALYLKCFAARPNLALQEFRTRLQKYSWLQVLDLAIDEDSVRGNQLNATFTFRYSLWGPGLKKGEIIQVNAAATRGGQGWSPGWRFSKFGEEVIVTTQRQPGYYPTSQMLQRAVVPNQPGAGQPQANQQRQPWGGFNFFNRR